MGQITSIALIGAAGRMGCEIARVVADTPTTRIGAAVEHVDSPAVGRPLSELAGVDVGPVVITTDLEQSVRSCDVVVDLSLPQATAGVVRQVEKCQKPLICGTTGIDNEALAAIDAAAKSIPLLYTTNLSLGVAVLRSLIRQAVSALGEYDIELVEMHHRHKADAPSGTAMTLAETAAEAAGMDPKNDLIFGREGHTGARPSRQIGVHAVRGGGVFGDHTLILADDHERLELTHRAESRVLFARGAVRAAQFLHGQQPGRYQMTDVLGL